MQVRVRTPDPVLQKLPRLPHLDIVLKHSLPLTHSIALDAQVRSRYLMTFTFYRVGNSRMNEVTCALGAHSEMQRLNVEEKRVTVNAFKPILLNP